LPERLNLLGAPLDPLTVEQAVEFVDGRIERGEPAHQASLNAAKVVRARKDPRLAEALWSCDLVLADGQAVVWASRLLGIPVPERVAGIDLMATLLDHAVSRDLRVFLLGARPDVIPTAAAEIERRHPGIRIVGAHHGYYTREEEPAILAAISAAKPHLLFIAFETPAKELFLGRLRAVASVPFAMGVGGSFDILAGRNRRAPLWMQRAGLEWLFRFLQEPRRLAWRYLVGNTLFIGLVAGELLHSRLRPKST
jgi:N-acetylglucosaminyldiphosphoundecaprenol N-acetyl-beta-D-mannosaminyltransferase